MQLFVGKTHTLTDFQDKKKSWNSKFVDKMLIYVNSNRSWLMEYSHAIWESMQNAVIQYFSNIMAHTNQQGILIGCRVRFTGLNGTRESAFLTSSQVMLMLLVRRLHLDQQLIEQWSSTLAACYREPKRNANVQAPLQINWDRISGDEIQALLTMFNVPQVLWTECITPKFVHWSPLPQCDGIWRWGFWEVP